MTESDVCKRKKTTKQATLPSPSPHAQDDIAIDDSTVSPLLLAALANDRSTNSHRSLIRRCLTYLRSSLLSQAPPLPELSISTFLSLIPLLLVSKHGDIARFAAETLGAASLCSLETNEEIVRDDVIVRALIYALLRSSRTKVSLAACNAILDLSTSSAGRQRLLEFSALDCLISKCLQLHVSSSAVSLLSKGRARRKSRIALKEDRYAVSLLHAVITLVNASKVEELDKIRAKDVQKFLAYLRNLWVEVHNQVLHGINSISGRDLSCANNIGVNGLAHSIFKISITNSQFTSLPTVLVKRGMFGSVESSFDDFLSSQWETSPVIIRSHSSPLTEKDEILGSFAEVLGCTESFPEFLSSMLRGFVSCLPIDSEELDIYNFLEEVKNELGCPMVYQQDLRVLRTESQSKREEHFFNYSSSTCYTNPLSFLSSSDIEKCEEAYQHGYTVALRGMEFRYKCIAAITEALASLFGQPSVGANLYLTPPQSQGLACHFDDHCVFVCQLLGAKQWTTYPPSMQLPRLYDQLDGKLGSHAECLLDGCRKFLLSVGDILYIPRGYPHEACTGDPSADVVTNFSLHLTFGIEVEPPFEWEGFMHVSLHVWYLRRKQHHRGLSEPLTFDVGEMSMTLFHALVAVLGVYDPTFRKACLVGALAPPRDSNNWLYSNQKTTFKDLVDKISTGPKILEVLKEVEKRENFLERMRWLCNLDFEETVMKELQRGINFTGISELSALYSEHKDTLEATFLLFRSRDPDRELWAFGYSATESESNPRFSPDVANRESSSLGTWVFTILQVSMTTRFEPVVQLWGNGLFLSRGQLYQIGLIWKSDGCSFISSGDCGNEQCASFTLTTVAMAIGKLSFSSAVMCEIRYTCTPPINSHSDPTTINSKNDLLRLSPLKIISSRQIFYSNVYLRSTPPQMISPTPPISSLAHFMESNQPELEGNPEGPLEESKFRISRLLPRPVSVSPRLHCSSAFHVDSSSFASIPNKNHVISKCSLGGSGQQLDKCRWPLRALVTSTAQDISIASLISNEKIGVLLLNLGGPETLDDVQPFLFNLFADPDIIRLPRVFRFLQKPLAQFISVVRAPKSKEGYAAIGGGSPLRQITDAQACSLSAILLIDITTS
ncbi:Ferrochelatase-2, chloroplastic [Linum perenne]